MVSGYATTGDIVSPRRTFIQMPAKNVVSWNAMIAGFVNSHMFDEAVSVFHHMLIDGKCKPDQTTLISTLSASTHLNSVKHRKWIRKNKLSVVSCQFHYSSQCFDRYVDLLAEGSYLLPNFSSPIHSIDTTYDIFHTQREGPSAINGSGGVIESIYVLIFLIFAPKKEKAKVLGLLLCILALFSAVALVSIFAIHKEKQRKLLCGFASSLFSMIMYASPLSVMRVVITTNSVEYMPFLLSLFVFVCGTCWFIYGLIGKDIFLIVSNGFGSVLGAMQLILYAIYYKNKGDNKKPSMDGSLEIGLTNPH
ncbi:hypothetical protein Pfo_017174 [Paulownia fortunei]|nr:hypothetical protein Pfo_017174 [Paulownia fortunei]